MGNTISQMKDHSLSLVPGQASHLSSDQGDVSRQVKLAILTTIAWCYFGYKYLPISIPNLSSAGDRLAYTLQCQLPSVSMMMLGVLEVASMRWRTKAINPLTPCEEEQRFQIHKNYLSNTTEQLILNTSAQLILSTFLEESQMKIIPLMSTWFVVGRILFWRGYLSSKQTNRAFGFGINAVQTVGILGTSWYMFIRNFCL